MVLCSIFVPALLPTAFVLHKTGQGEQSTRHEHSNKVSNKLSEILSNEIEFELFIQHLCRECAMETLLCFIEMFQWKNRIKSELNVRVPNRTQRNVEQNYHALNQNDFYNWMSCRLDKNKEIPQSHIVYGNNEVNG
eukprot:153311_1